MALDIGVRCPDVGDLSRLFGRSDTPERHVRRRSDQRLACKRLDVGRRGIMGCNREEGICMAEEQGTEFGLAEANRVLEDGLEHRLQLAG